MVDDLSSRLARRLKLERETRGWSVSDLATRSGVSRAMISKIERGEASPTAVLLGRLSGAFSLTLSTLLARAEGRGDRLRRAAEQPVWEDPDSGYERRALSPPNDGALDLTAVMLPAGARIAYPASAYAFIRQQILVQEGRLTFVEGAIRHELAAGDCLELGEPADCVFINESRAACRYLVVVARR